MLKVIPFEGGSTELTIEDKGFWVMIHHEKEVFDLTNLYGSGDLAKRRIQKLVAALNKTYDLIDKYV